MRVARLAAFAFGIVVAILGATPAADSGSAPKAKLLVLVVFDQFRGDYLERWDSLYTSDGFHRLEHGGTWFTNCHYPYATTMTGPGHASLGTGCSADRHGIITNEWYDRTAGETVYCATMPRYRVVSSLSPPEQEAAIAKDKKKDKGSGTPDRMMVPTFAETLKTATGGASKIVALSLKDRSAVMPGGRTADACYWFDDRLGQFVTSTFYRDRPHNWVSAFNQSHPADHWFDAPWVRLRSDIDYARFSGPDDIAAEGTGVAKKQGRVFPHPMSAGLKHPGRDYYDTVETSPYGNELLLDFALHAVQAEKLGTGEATDFLSISFSSNDLIGHQYGPDSQEVLDVTLRSDLIVRDLLAGLDKLVGVNQYCVVLSADHGICPIPEVAAAEGKDAKRINAVQFGLRAMAFMAGKYGAPGGNALWIENQAYPWIYLNHKLIASHQLKVEDVAEALADYLHRQDGIQAVYTRRQLDAPATAGDDTALKLMRKSYYRDRCGDLALVTKPYYLITPYPTGTSHGTPHPYDTHVPLLVFGPGIQPGRCQEPVTPQAAVPILARIAGIAPPATAEATLPERFQAK